MPSSTTGGHDVPVGPADEEVGILRVPADSGVANEREGATDEKIDVWRCRISMTRL